MKLITRVQLSAMFFLEFFIWGGWFVTLGTYLLKNLDATGAETGMAFSTQSWGAIIAPFIIGFIADKYFNAERILGILHLIGAVLMYRMATSADFSTFYPYVLGYMIAFMPTLALVNSVAFRQMNDPAKDFAWIRVFGTVGWIVAGALISYVFFWDSQEGVRDGLLRNTFVMTAVASAVLGVYSFFLPKTPPDKTTKSVSLAEKTGLSAISILKDKNFPVFFIASILISIPLAFYYQNTNPFLTEIGVGQPTGLMAIGQVSEVLFMLLLPVFLLRFGIKKTLLLGMIAWVIRYLLFAYGNSDELTFMLIIGIALHGVCYDFFFVSGQIYTDSKAKAGNKSAAQGLITLATYGVGMLIGFWVAGKMTDLFSRTVTTADGGTEVVHVWEMIWIYPAGFAVFVFLFFLITFKSEKIEYKGEKI